MFSYEGAAEGSTGRFGAVTDRFVLVLTTSTEVALRLWRELEKPGVTIEDALTLLTSHGLSRLPDFALVELVDAATGSVAVAVRGRGEAELDGASRRLVSGDGARTWVEGTAQGIRAMSIRLRDETSGGVRLPLGRGLVATTRVQWGALEGAEPGDEPETDSAAPVPTPIPASVPTPIPVPAWAAGVAAEQDQELDDHTVLGSARTRAPLAEPDDDRTVLGSRTRAPEYELHLDTGVVVALDGVVVVGRSARAGAAPGVRVQTVPSPRKEVSSAHAELHVDDGRLHVRDLGSTNGTVLRPSGAPARVLRGSAGVIAPGDRVDFGDGNVGAFVRLPSTPAGGERSV